jgi:hypothetical protein
MAISAGTINWYYSALHYLWTGRIDVDSDTFVMGLSTSSYTPNQSLHSLLAHITNELSGNGYARQTLTGVAVAPDGSPWTATQAFQCDDPEFEADGGNLVARWWWIYDDTPTSPADPLLCYGLLDETPADVTTLDGNLLTFEINAAGLLELEAPEV